VWRCNGRDDLMVSGRSARAFCWSGQLLPARKCRHTPFAVVYSQYGLKYGEGTAQRINRYPIMVHS
jgi:hypothetical protein